MLAGCRRSAGFRLCLTCIVDSLQSRLLLFGKDSDGRKIQTVQSLLETTDPLQSESVWVLPTQFNQQVIFSLHKQLEHGHGLLSKNAIQVCAVWSHLPASELLVSRSRAVTFTKTTWAEGGAKDTKQTYKTALPLTFPWNDPSGLQTSFPLDGVDPSLSWPIYHDRIARDAFRLCLCPGGPCTVTMKAADFVLLAVTTALVVAVWSGHRAHYSDVAGGSDAATADPTGQATGMKRLPEPAAVPDRRETHNTGKSASLATRKLAEALPASAPVTSAIGVESRAVDLLMIFANADGHLHRVSAESSFRALLCGLHSEPGLEGTGADVHRRATAGSHAPNTLTPLLSCGSLRASRSRLLRCADIPVTGSFVSIWWWTNTGKRQLAT